MTVMEFINIVGVIFAIVGTTLMLGEKGSRR